MSTLRKLTIFLLIAAVLAVGMGFRAQPALAANCTQYYWVKWGDTLAGIARWYGVSWKGSDERSGGIVTNIGIHFFDLLLWLFGDVQECVVHERLEKKMTAAFWAVHNAAQQHKVHNRLGAYLVAVNRVAEAVRLRGWA